MSRKDILDDVLRGLSTMEHKQIIDVHRLAMETKRDPRTIREYLNLVATIGKVGVLVAKYEESKDPIYYVCRGHALKADMRISNE